MLPLLMGCDPSGRADGVRLTDLPADLRACVTEVTGRPAGAGAMSQRDVVALVGKLRASELRLSGCGQRLVALYDAQAAALAGGGK